MRGKRLIDGGQINKELIKLKKTELPKRELLKRLEDEIMQEKVDKMWNNLVKSEFSKNVHL